MTTADAKDTGQPDVARDVTTPVDGAGDAPGDARPDVGPDAPAPDASDARAEASDGGSLADARDGSEASSPDASDASPGTDASDATVPDASDASTCTTSLAILSDAGSGTIPPSLLFSFDNTDGGVGSGWGSYSFPATIAPVLSESLTEGHLCPGALALNLSYASYGTNSGATFNYGAGASAQDWTGRVRLHFSVKVVTSDYATINGLEGVIYSRNYGMPNRYGAFLQGSALSGGGWVPAVVDLTPPPVLDAAGIDYDPTTVNGFEIQLQTVTTSTDGGAAPPPAALFVDDIWLE